MVPPPEDNMPPPPTPTPKDQEPTQGKKTTTTTTKPAPEQSIKCPRCDSPNTKFCYYNNYSLTQPRHFCKTCRRYWTNGGALRNVPIGGGCRKNKRVKPSSSSSSSTSSRFSTEFSLHGLNVPPSVEFNLGALPFPSRLNTNHHHIPTPTTGLFNNQFSSFGADVNSVSATNGLSLSGFQLDPPASNSLMGLQSADLWPALGRAQSSTLSDPLTSAMQSMQQQPMQQQPSMNVHSSLASSIESLSSINHDLHLKMQQQRLATMMYGGDSHNKGGDVSLNGFENQKLLNPVMFQNLEISKPEESLPAGSSVAQGPSGETTVTAATPTEWFFGNSSFPSAATTPSTSNGGANGNNNNINDIANNNWSTGALAWGDLQHQPFSALP